MGWHVRYIDSSLKHEMLSREWATEDEALEEAWKLAQKKRNQVTAIEGPDEEIVSIEEIQAWFEKRCSPGEAGASS
jgi:translation initiation factor 1 (eIF-1/SUI1)